MACACNKRPQPTSYGSTPKRAPESVIPPSEETQLQRPDGTIVTFPSRFEAHAERLRHGGKVL